MTGIFRATWASLCGATLVYNGGHQMSSISRISCNSPLYQKLFGAAVAIKVQTALRPAKAG